ncbi:DUF4244 domain-containing protein [Kribbella sindirgiensis]|uniref:DUF4244 domain-containing protein n=1 Tax=Kribbella sindirgiensis TaxID=1124744 RepID=UPI00192D6597|nr:DUF4244 domain-containing protein [Kribbella sindirgiensis]
MPNSALATTNQPRPTQATPRPVPRSQLELSTPDTSTRVRRTRLTPFRALRPRGAAKIRRTTELSLLRQPGADRTRSTGIRRLYSKGINRLRHRAERGAVTAEYAIMIVGACAIGGVLVALLRSPAMQNALKSIINYGLKLAGVEGVHL